MYSQAAQRFNINPQLVAPLPPTPQIDQQLAEIRAQTSSENREKIANNSEEFFRSLPKAELHLHSTAMADLFTTAPLAWDISGRHDRGLQMHPNYGGSLESLMNDFLSPQAGSLIKYLEKYDLLKNYLIRDLDAVRETSYQGAMQAFANGVRILEIRTSIKAGDYGDPRSKGVMTDVSYNAYQELCARIEGFQKAEKDSNGQLRVVMIVTFRRQDSIENSMALLDDVLRYREMIKDKFGCDYIVGVDIAGQEFLHKAKRFEKVFRRAREEGLRVTAHAGEEAGAGEGSIWQALNSGAQRIGHGSSLYFPWPMLPETVRHEVHGLRKNAAILALMLGTPFEWCPTSNLVCGAEITTGYRPNPDGDRPFRESKIMERYDEYPAKMLIALGTMVYQGRSPILPIPCTDGIYTLNTDLAREYAIVAATLNLGVKELLAISRYSFRHSFAPKPDRARALRQWREFAGRYLTDEDYSIPDGEAKKALHDYRRQVRRELGISMETLEQIEREVSSSKRYLNEYLHERFKKGNEKRIV